MACAIGQVFDGNVDSYQVKHAYLDEPIIGRYIKLHMVSWHRHPSMRVEIIGCQGQSISRLGGIPTYLRIQQEAFEKYWAHSLLRAAVTLPVTRCR